MHTEVRQTDDPQNLIVLGWVLVDRLGKAETDALSDGRAKVLERLETAFPEFTWQMPVVHSLVPSVGEAREPVKLLKHGVHELDLRHWDFTFVVTRDHLKTRYKPYALAVPSRALGVAIISIAQLMTSHGMGEVVPRHESGDFLRKRMFAVAMHLMADLNGISHSTEPARFTYELSTAEDLDRMNRYSDREHELLRETLANVADARLEERPGAMRGGSLGFYLKASRIGFFDIASAVVQAKPWQFPYRLSRLTTTATSALVILLMTAEVWDLGVSRPLPFVAGLSFLALVLTSAFTVEHHKLIMRRGQNLTEQNVIKHVSIVIVVFLGMVTTYLLLFGLSSLFMLALFDSTLVHEWTDSPPNSLGSENYLALAGMISSLGIVIGALGASFEEEYYFQHIIYVDEET